MRRTDLWAEKEGERERGRGRGQQTLSANSMLIFQSKEATAAAAEHKLQHNFGKSPSTRLWQQEDEGKGGWRRGEARAGSKPQQPGQGRQEGRRREEAEKGIRRGSLINIYKRRAANLAQPKTRRVYGRKVNCQMTK